jgi:hypothetical protein
VKGIILQINFIDSKSDILELGMSTKEIGFEVFTAVSTKMAVFWVVAPCSLVEVYQRFRGPCHQSPDDGGSKDL